MPVLLEEALEYLNVRPGGVYVDATLGLGGHSSAIAKKLGGQGKLIAFDRDPDAMSKAQARLEALKEELGAEMPAVQFEPRAFSEAGDALAKGSLDGLLADFGVSSMQLDEAHRGFSFRSDGPLDMRMDTRSGETAGQVVNEEDETNSPTLFTNSERKGGRGESPEPLSGPGRYRRQRNWLESYRPRPLQ